MPPNIGNTSSGRNVKGRVRGEKWARMKVERQEVVINLCCGLEATGKAASEAPTLKW
jgi:hypothetical protein